MADLPLDLDAGLDEHLARVLDVEHKIPRALEALGPVEDRDVVLVDSPAGIRARQLEELGARVTLGAGGPAGFDVPDSATDVVVSMWSSLRGTPEPVLDAELAEIKRVLRPGGRLLAVHDYGRDDVSTLRGDRPEYTSWSRRDGPFLRRGFRIRVVHCFWTFPDLDDVRAFVAAAFGERAVLPEGLTRPRLSYNVAVYHRTFGDATR